MGISINTPVELLVCVKCFNSTNVPTAFVCVSLFVHTYMLVCMCASMHLHMNTLARWGRHEAREFVS